MWRSSAQTPKLSYRFIVLATFAVLAVALLARPRSIYLFRSSGDYFLWLIEWLTVIPHSSFWQAFWGALISPGKGLLIFAPFVILVIGSWLVEWRSTWQKLLGPTLWLVTIVIAQSFFYDHRWTNPQWGARYLLPALPGLAVATLPAINWMWQRSRRFTWVVLGVTLGAGLFTQLPGVLIAPPTYSAIVQQLDRQAYLYRAIWDTYYSAVAGHWRLIVAGQPWALAGVRNFPLNPVGVIVLVGSLLAIAGAATVILKKALVQPPMRWHKAGAIVLPGILILIFPFLILFTYRQEPGYFGHRPDMGNAIQFLNRQVEDDDLVAIRGYELWHGYFNYGRPVTTWVGLPAFDLPSDTVPTDPFFIPGIDAQEADLALFDSASDAYKRLWYVDDGSLPTGTEGFDVEAWLLDRYTRLDRRTFGTDTGISVSVFVLEDGL